MVGFDRPESGFNSSVYVEARLVHEVVEALAVELPFHFRKNRLDWVEFRRITDVPNRLHI